jgi:phospholipid/cholesterol/gamma-HCH transport system permease protein
MIEPIGHKTIEILEEFGNFVNLFFQTVRYILSGKTKIKLVFEQMVKVGIDSLPLALISAAFVGMVFAVQVASEFVKFGAGKFIGGVMGIAVARELSPALAGIVIASRVAAAFAAELGTMKVTEQIDALNALGTNPVKYLVVPRFLSCTFMLPLLTIFSDIVAFLGGYYVSIYLVHINPIDYMESANSLLELNDIFGGIAKSLFFGMTISIIACYRGLSTTGGAKGVGEATTRAVVTSLIALFILNYFLSVLFFK